MSIERELARKIGEESLGVAEDRRAEMDLSKPVWRPDPVTEGGESEGGSPAGDQSDRADRAKPLVDSLCGWKITVAAAGVLDFELDGLVVFRVDLPACCVRVAAQKTIVDFGLYGAPGGWEQMANQSTMSMAEQFSQALLARERRAVLDQHPREEWARRVAAGQTDESFHQFRQTMLIEAGL